MSFFGLFLTSVSFITLLYFATYGSNLHNAGALSAEYGKSSAYVQLSTYQNIASFGISASGIAMAENVTGINISEYGSMYLIRSQLGNSYAIFSN